MSQFKKIISGTKNSEFHNPFYYKTIDFDQMAMFNVICPKSTGSCVFTQVPYTKTDLEMMFAELDKVIKYVEELPDKKRIIYLGLGTSNSGKWGNESPPWEIDRLLEYQKFPMFLRKAIHEGYQVIRINIDFFNEKERGLKIEDKNHFSINISAKFPLNVEKKLESDAGDGIIKRIGTLTKQKNSKVVIMNAISDRNYPGILKVVKSTHAIYIKSYLAMTLDPEHVKIYKRNEDGELFWQTHTEDVHLLNSDLNNFIQFANYA